MPLPSSGSISLSQIRNEFSLGSGQIAMSQLRTKGNAPASGAVLMGGHFHGVSAVTNLALFTLNIGSRNIKAGQDEYGFMTTAYGATGMGTSNYGSTTPSAQTVNGRNISAIVCYVDTAVSNSRQLRVVFGGTSAFTNWTTMKIDSASYDRSTFTGAVNNGTYRFTRNVGGNVIGTGGTRTITFL
tara:strand:- start:5097 stop:5651 length:555 start_codon:yes stop_codon:yes gene_type:complete